MKIGPSVAAILAATMAACAADVQPTRTHLVEIRQFEFAPDTIDVSPGDTIRWINHDFVPHTATAADTTWDSGRMEANGEWMMVAGQGNLTMDYICSYHPNMTGTLRIGS